MERKIKKLVDFVTIMSLTYQLNACTHTHTQLNTHIYIYIYIYIISLHVSTHIALSSGKTLVTCSKLSPFDDDVTSAAKHKAWMVQYAPKHVGGI